MKDQIEQTHPAKTASSIRYGIQAGACAERTSSPTLEPQPPEIPRALGRAFELSQILSGELATLDGRIRPVSRCPLPSPDAKQVETETEIGSAIEQLNARMELMLSAVGSMIHRLEV